MIKFRMNPSAIVSNNCIAAMVIVSNQLEGKRLNFIGANDGFIAKRKMMLKLRIKPAIVGILMPLDKIVGKYCFFLILDFKDFAEM